MTQRNNMLVAVRVRPLSKEEQSAGQNACVQVVGDQVVTIEKSSQPRMHLRSQQGSSNEYAFDVAFNEKSTQEEIYSKTVKSMVPTVLDGFNATVFAYGSTGSGKTFTMMGSERNEDTLNEAKGKSDGIIPQVLMDIFALINERREQDEITRQNDGTVSEWKVFVSYLEVYNEQIHDLLQPTTKPLSLREDPAQGVVHVVGLHNAQAKNKEEVIDLLRRGNRNRKTEPTAANKVSSRSHAVLQVIVKHVTTTMFAHQKPKESVVEGRMSMIDLAGSERASATQNRGLRMTEGANINKSLLALANCINALASNQKKKRISRRRSDIFSMSSTNKRIQQTSPERPRIAKAQYRDSKLTHLLKSSLEGDCRLVMIANINPCHSTFEESHNTLKYANRAKNIKVRPRMHVVTADLTHQQRADRLEKENVELRSEIATLRSLASKRKKESDEDENTSTPYKKRKSMDPLSEGTQLAFATDSLTISEQPQYEHENLELMKVISALTQEKEDMSCKIKSLEIQVQKLRQSHREKSVTTPSIPPRRSKRLSALTPVDENIPTSGVIEDKALVQKKVRRLMSPKARRSRRKSTLF